MNLNSAATLVPSLESLFGQVHGWTLPQTVINLTNLRGSSYLEGVIKIGAGKCNEGTFSFVWFHEAFHFVQFVLEGRDAAAYHAVASPYLACRDTAGYVWVREEREANMFAYEMCEKMGLTDFIPEWIPAGYFI